MTENNLYALKQVYKCNIAPENLEVRRAGTTMYTKHFRQEITAKDCAVNYQNEQWHCGFGDDSGMDAQHAGRVTKDLTVTASQCKTLANGGSITLKDETLTFKKKTKTTVVRQEDFDDNEADLSDKYRNKCNSYEWVNRKTFEGHVQDVVLEVRSTDGNVMSKNGLQWPCPLENLVVTLIHSTHMHSHGTPRTIAYWPFIGKKTLTWSNKGKTTKILPVDVTTPVSNCSR